MVYYLYFRLNYYLNIIMNNNTYYKKLPALFLI